MNIFFDIKYYNTFNNTFYDFPITCYNYFTKFANKSTRLKNR